MIGSGFGGAVAACRLAQAGRSVAVLERGRRWDKHEFPRTIGQVAEAFWQEGRSHGFLEYRAFSTLDVVQGAGVGGGSLHYFNVNLRAPAEVFAHPPWPAAIDRAALDPYYALAEDMLESAPLRVPPGQRDLPGRAAEFLTAARHAGYAAEQVPVAVVTEAERTHPVSGLPQSPCTYCGNCLLGCHLHAKNTLDLNYLPLAEHHGAEIHPLHVAERIRPLPEGGYEVAFRRLDPDPAGPAESASVRAGQVVVAAGTLGSTALLLACRDRHRSLPGLGPALGSRFSANGELLFAHARDTRQRTDPGIGPPIVGRTTVARDGHVITVEDLGLPDQLLWFFEGAMPPRSGRLRNLAALAASYLKRSLWLGGRTSRLSIEMDALVAGGRTPRTIPYLGMGTDTADGRIDLHGEALDIDWSPRRNRKMYRLMREVMTDVSEAAGGTFATSLLWRWPLRKILTAHPLGGCPMGDDPATSVVDDRGEVWGHPGLYVVDGAVVPGGLAINPSLTIAALAERAAFRMTCGRELYQGDPDAPPNR